MVKKVLWFVFGREILFSLNWLEYWIIKRIFRKRKYRLLKEKKLKGRRVNLLMVDEAVNVDWDKVKKLNLKKHLKEKYG